MEHYRQVQTYNSQHICYKTCYSDDTSKMVKTNIAFPTMLANFIITEILDSIEFTNVSD